MAGTRLLVHSIFLGQFLLLIAISLYFGLCQRGDRVCVPLFQQDGRALLRQSIEDSEAVLSEKLTFPPVTLVSAYSQIPFWKKALRNIQSDSTHSDHIRVQKEDQDGDLQAACSNPVTSQSQLEHGHGHDMWLCEHFRTRDQALMVVRNGTSFFYPTSMSRRTEELKSIYPESRGPASSTATAPLSRDNHLHLVIAVDKKRSDWKLWMAAVNEWMVTSRIQQWPFLAASQPKVHFQVVDWSQKVQVQVSPVVTMAKDDDGDDNNSTTTTSTSYELLLDEEMLSSLPSPLDDGPSDSKSTSTWYATVYIPSQFPLTVKEDPATVVTQRENRIVTVIPREPVGDSDSDLDDSYSNLTHAALGSITDWMVTRCMGLPTMDSDATATDTATAGGNVVWDSDGSFPNWYLQLWYQRVLPAVYDETVSMVRRERQLLLEKPRTVAITVEVAESWQRAVAGIEQAAQQCRRGGFEAALDSLELTSQYEIKSLQKQPDLGEPLDFPIEQYGAIFAPLMFPLLLPMLAGLGREIKRYRTLGMPIVKVA
jgi:hypothetical protein